MRLNPGGLSRQDVRAEIVYTADTAEKLVVENYGPGFRFVRTTGVEERRGVTIRNGRVRAARWSLDESGFVLAGNASAVSLSPPDALPRQSVESRTLAFF